MRTASLTAAAAATLLAGTPALATSSIHCRTRAGGPDLWLGVGNGADIGLFQVRIVNGREEIVTGDTRGAPWLAQKFVNERRLSFRIAPGGARGTLAALTAVRRGVPYVGSFTWRGRNWPVRCFWDEDDEG
jgi:hypothetical protein